MKKNRIKGLLSLVMVLLLALTLANPVKANVVDITKPASLEVHYFGEQTEISIYKVADVVDENANISVCETFADYPLDFSDASNWQGVAQALQGYIAADKIEATKVQTTNADGIAKFDELEQGVYYVCGAQVIYDGYTYTTMPALVSVPRVVEGNATYDVVINMKHEKVKYYEDVDVNVTKIWKDAGSESARPSEIEVGLYKDGVLFDQQKLNEGNGWNYTWKALEGKPTWTIVELSEKEPYTVTLDKEGNNYVITNTYESGDIEDNDGNDPNLPDHPDGPDKPSDITEGDNSGNIDPSNPDKNIPQTGQLWLPVMVLCALGLGSLCVGLVLKRKGN